MSRPMIRTLVGALAASMLVAAGVGCTRENKSVAPSSGTNSKTPYQPCTSNADCSGGNICTTIGCCPGCHSDADCGSSETCTISPAGNFCSPKNMSQPPTPTNPAPLAAQPHNVSPPQHCTLDSNCAAGWLCDNGTCAPKCSDSLACASGQSCVAGRCYSAGVSTCGSAGLVTCSLDDECGANHLCVGGNCALACSTSTSCPIGQVCGSGGACVDDPKPATAQCAFDADCGVAFRCINAYCHPLCSSDSQCGSNTFCDHGVCRADYRLPTG
jgi:Cys-rich repeat protein